MIFFFVSFSISRFKLSQNISIILFRVKRFFPQLIPEMCGVRTTLSIFLKAWFSGNGSGLVTSRTAPLITPCSHAFVKSSVFTIKPRPTFTSIALFFIFSILSASNIPSVSFVPGSAIMTTSALCN